MSLRFVGLTGALRRAMAAGGQASQPRSRVHSRPQPVRSVQHQQRLAPSHAPALPHFLLQVGGSVEKNNLLAITKLDPYLHLVPISANGIATLPGWEESVAEEEQGAFLQVSHKQAAALFHYDLGLKRWRYVVTYIWMTAHHDPLQHFKKGGPYLEAQLHGLYLKSILSRVIQDKPVLSWYKSHLHALIPRPIVNSADQARRDIARQAVENRSGYIVVDSFQISAVGNATHRDASLCLMHRLEADRPNGVLFEQQQEHKNRLECERAPEGPVQVAAKDLLTRVTDARRNASR